ncbi:hypothetical protein, partial [Klebsiella pneumoniae]
QNDVTLKMPAFEWVHVQLHQQKGMISLSPPTICNSAKKTGPRQLTRRRQRFFPVPERVSRLMLMIPCLKTELTLPTILLVLMSR